MTNLLEIPRNNLNNIKDTLLIVFKIEIDTKIFIARFLNDKFEKSMKTISKVLAKQLLPFLTFSH